MFLDIYKSALLTQFMDFFNPSESDIPEIAVAKPKVSQEQIQDLIFGEDVSWQAILYDLINTEQLDPWDIDISQLTDKYLNKIKALEEANFLVSSKVLLAAALLLYIKSEMLVSHYIKSIDEILFGKKEDKRKTLERIELDEDLPDLMPRSPLPRLRKISLQELMESLNKAIITENRRIKKHILEKNALRESSISLPEIKRVNISQKINALYDKIEELLKKESEAQRVPLSQIAGKSNEERIAMFIPLLHLDNQKKVWLEQNSHFDEIHIWLHNVFRKHKDIYEDLRKELEIVNNEITISESDWNSDKVETPQEELSLEIEDFKTTNQS